jgi:hypothetical protein
VFVKLVAVIGCNNLYIGIGQVKQGEGKEFAFPSPSKPDTLFCRGNDKNRLHKIIIE